MVKASLLRRLERLEAELAPPAEVPLPPYDAEHHAITDRVDAAGVAAKAEGQSDEAAMLAAEQVLVSECNAYWERTYSGRWQAPA